METNPAFYGLPGKVQLEEIDENTLGIRKIIKSRIIKKNAEKITEMAAQIKEVAPQVDVVLICSHNICSKSLKLLSESNIAVKYVE